MPASVMVPLEQLTDTEIDTLAADYERKGDAAHAAELRRFKVAPFRRVVITAYEIVMESEAAGGRPVDQMVRDMLRRLAISDASGPEAKQATETLILAFRRRAAWHGAQADRLAAEVKRRGLH